MQILCRTFFDCSPTGITGHYRPSQVPFTDGAGNTINNQHDWTFARNQQRNWETLNQLISLRTQPFDIVIFYTFISMSIFFEYNSHYSVVKVCNTLAPVDVMGSLVVVET